MSELNWKKVDDVTVNTYQLEDTDEFIHVIKNKDDQFLVIHAGENSKDAGKTLKLSQEQVQLIYEIEVE